MNLPKIKWAEISKERLIHEVVVDAEVECMLSRLRWCLVTYPIKPSWNDFDWLVLGDLRSSCLFRC